MTTVATFGAMQPGVRPLGVLWRIGQCLALLWIPMLEIHDHQVSALTLAAIIDQLAAECRQALPRHYRALGTAGVRVALVDGIEAARSYGIDFEDGWRAYIRLMFLFDREFDQRLPWARESLAASDGATGLERINALIVAAREEIEGRRAARKAES